VSGAKEVPDVPEIDAAAAADSENAGEAAEQEEIINGIPQFWLQSLMRHEAIAVSSWHSYCKCRLRSCVRARAVFVIAGICKALAARLCNVVASFYMICKEITRKENPDVLNCLAQEARNSRSSAELQRC
jgi:hypothetical protein